MCRLRGLLCKVSYFIGNNGEAFSCRTCTSRLYRRIQGENIRLERNVINSLNDFIDFIGLLRDFRHGTGHFLHLTVTEHHRFSGFRGKMRCFLCRTRSFFDLCRNFTHGGTQLLNGRCLFYCTVRKPLCCCADLIRTAVYFQGTRLYFRHSTGKVCRNLRKCGKQR